MDRRTALSMLGGGIVVGRTGYPSVTFEESGPVGFILLNFTESPQVVEVSIRDDEGVRLVESYVMEAGIRVEPDEIKEKGLRKPPTAKFSA